MTRPMWEEEREHALRLARQTIEWAPHSSVATHIFARALLSTSASERGLREALEKIQGYCERRMSPPSYATHGKHIMAVVLEALSPKGEDELARGQGRSAPTHTDTKDTTR